jgi:hypothetical protein
MKKKQGTRSKKQNTETRNLELQNSELVFITQN